MSGLHAVSRQLWYSVWVDTHLPALADASGFCGFNALGLTLAPKTRLELGRHAEHIEKSLSCGGAGVLAFQQPDLELSDYGILPPAGDEVRAAEQRDRARFPRVVRLCREADRSRDMNTYVKRFADKNGLSSYGRVSLAMYCRLYMQGIQDSRRTPLIERRSQMKADR